MERLNVLAVQLMNCRKRGNRLTLEWVLESARILAEAPKIHPKLYTVTGGFHLVMTPEDEVRRVASVLRDDLKVERVAPGHCTSELGFAVFLERFGDHFDKMGVGAVLGLP